MSSWKWKVCIFPQTHGYNIPNLPSVLGTQTLYETSYPATGDHGYTYEISQPETVGTHTYDTSQPEISYHSSHTFESQSGGQISQILEQYPWLTQWQQQFGLAPNYSTFGFSQSSQDTFGGSHHGNGQENPGQENAYENPFTQALNPSADINDNSQASETVSKASPGETDDGSEPPPYPYDNSDDDDSDGESSGDDEPPKYLDEPPKYFYEPPKNLDEPSKYFDEPPKNVNETPKYFDEPPKYIDETRDTNASSDQNNDTKSAITPEGINSEAKKNTATPRPPQMSSMPQPEPEPGTMSRPVPKLGLLFAPSLQWHVGIYSKTFTPYMQVCGGSLVRADVVLSAAHCFWDDNVGALRPGLFAVAAGKLLRPWETEGEIYTQHSDIKDIKIPPRFRGSKTSFQDDIAIVLLTTSLEYAPGVKPVCVSFDLEMDQRHLSSGNLGKIAGWGLTEINGPPSQRLNYLELPYVDIEECLRTADDSFLKYITSDKICAGDQKTGRALCRGDSGGGLIYFSSSIPYLHGVASTAPRDNNKCNAYAVASFTHVQAHMRFLIGHVPDIGEGCEELYVDTTGTKQNKTEITPENASLTPSGSSLAQEEDRISTNLALESGISNVTGPQIYLTAPSQNDKNEEANTGEPMSLTVLHQNDEKGVSNTGETISNPTVISQDNEESNTGEPISLIVPHQNGEKGLSNIGETDSNLTISSQNDKNGISITGETISNPTVTSEDANDEESNTEEPVSLTVPSHGDKNRLSNTGETISNLTVASQDADNEESNTEEPISLTTPSENNKNGLLNTGEQISNLTLTNLNDKNGMSNTQEPISLTVPNQNVNNRDSNAEIQISSLTESEGDRRPIWDTNESNEEVVMNVRSGERGVARIAVDNSTRTFVCNCYCNE
ncbi:uncharacterized protein LOC133531389 isoform X2 [Cydia pomonella]|uniref:uncharacterized protein LOC133531389 isoform X2 n=1 Tax=Cydia pomonella TaxID=82600 RepID=UPI002ADE2EA0|nr:uncharacterized protein LOC133531389 isoform X2 [Cydia pomonella]